MSNSSCKSKSRAKDFSAVLLGPLVFWSCSAKRTEPLQLPTKQKIPSERAIKFERKKMLVSFYGLNDGLDGQKTASGELFRADALTAAHRSLPFGTRLKVRNPENGKVVVVTVNDRGPYTPGRHLDLSAEAAKRLGILTKGVSSLEVSTESTQ